MKIKEEYKTKSFFFCLKKQIIPISPKKDIINWGKEDKKKVQPILSINGKLKEPIAEINSENRYSFDAAKNKGS